MLAVAFLVTLMLLFYYIVLKIFEPRFKMKKRIDVFVSADKIKSEETKKEFSIRKMFILFRDKIKFILRIKVSLKKEEDIENMLLKAGNPFGMTAIDYHVFTIVLKLLLPGIFGIYGKALGLGILGIILLAILGEIVAFIFPKFYINQKIKERSRKALLELPDFLDILTVCLEAGLGFDGALNKVISKKTGVLSSEFHICLEEIRLGKTRKEALNGVKNRIDSDEIKSLINSILQAEKMGISIVQVFRVKSQEEREKRRQRAEEEALKAPVKILFPLVLFIFPSIFIVILGPAVIQMISEFGKF